MEIILVSLVEGGAVVTCRSCTHNMKDASSMQWKVEIEVGLLMQNQENWWHKDFLKKEASYAQDGD